MLVQNGLLQAMSPADRAAMAPHLQRVSLVRGQVLEEPVRRVDKAYFFESGLAALSACSQDKAVGVGMVGNEGMTGIGAVLQADLPTIETRVQSDGEALAIPAADLQALFSDRPTLRTVLLRFVQVCHTQASQNTLCNSLALMKAKLARWILMSHDRSRGADIRVTHDFIALMLGFRRQGITFSLNELEGMRLLQSTRENIRVLDRAGLIAQAGSFYGVCEAEYSRLIMPVANLWPHIGAQPADTAAN